MLYAVAIATAKLLPTQVSPTMPITLATRALDCAVSTASVTVLAADPVTPSQFTMSWATWSLPVDRNPTIATREHRQREECQEPVQSDRGRGRAPVQLGVALVDRSAARDDRVQKVCSLGVGEVRVVGLHVYRVLPNLLREPAMRRSIDDSIDDHPDDDDERPPVSWAVALSDDCDACGIGEPRVVLTMEEVGRAGLGLVAHLAPATARRMRAAIAAALREIGEDAGP